MSVESPEAVDPRVAQAREIVVHAQGGDTFYRHWTGRIRYSQAVHYLAEVAGCHWLVDLIASHQPSVLRKVAKARDRDFQVWTLLVMGDKTASAICDNGNGLRYKRQYIPFTDFPLDTVKLYVADGVLMLPGEY